MQNNLIVILGATATGKTNLAANLAAEIDGEIISADSRQVYRGMDVGTGKDLADFVVDGKNIPYHLIDIIDAGAEYNVFEYQKDFLPVYEDILKRGKQAILCGGTGMYLESVLKGYRFLEIPENKELRAELELKSIDELVIILKQEKEVHNTTDTIYKKRIIRAIEIAKFQAENQALIRDFPQINSTIFGIKFDRDERRERITKRLKKRFKEEGMLEEVKQLMENGVSAEKLKFYGLEYKIITEHLLGEITYNEMFDKLNVAIHQFAKRQMTWFRKMERNGFTINWIDGSLSLDDKLAFILKRIDE